MVLAGTVILLAACFSLVGWGALVNRFTSNPPRNLAVILVIGLGVIVFLGGVLNLLCIAYGWAFDSVIIGGIILAAVFRNAFKSIIPQNKGEWIYLIMLGIVIALIMGSTMKTQLPPKAFNFHDDFEKYFSYPVRMLQTGTLFGSPLSAIGLETLGGQAVLHGIILNHFPIPYINGADAVLGLFLCLILPVSIIPRRLSYLPISVITMLMVFFINPQYVNVSALYLGSTLMMAAILLFSQEHENIHSEDKSVGSCASSGRPWTHKKKIDSHFPSSKKHKTTENALTHDHESNLPSPLIAGLIYAALLALKSTFLFFPIVHIITLSAAFILFGTYNHRVLRWVISTGCMTLVFLSPWLLLHFSHYIHKSPVPLLNPVPAFSAGEVNPFSLSPLFYGASFAHYTFLALVTICPVILILLWRLKDGVISRCAHLAGTVASSIAVFSSYLFLVALGAKLVSYDVNLRYAIPALIAGVPTVTTLALLAGLKERAMNFRVLFISILMIFEVMIVIGFSGSFINRMHQAFQSGHILAFSKFATSHAYLKYNNEVLYGDAAFRISEAQKHVPVGQPLVAWVSTPFFFDYKRNVIFDVDPSGLGSPWASIPKEAEYFIMEYRGFAVRPISKYYEDLQDPGRRQPAEICIGFLQTIMDRSKNADEIYNDGKLIVFKVKLPQQEAS